MNPANWTKICCAVDFSKASEHALQAAADLARRLNSELILLHVAERPGRGGRPTGEVRDAVAARMAEERAALNEWRRRASALIKRDVETVTVTGLPPHEILSFARLAGCRLLVLGTHGRTGLRRTVFGSVAEQVVRQAPCPVLTVRPPDDTRTSRTIARVS